MSNAPINPAAAVVGSQAWMDEIVEFGCYDCGHEGSESDPCDEFCGPLPTSWSQMQLAAVRPGGTP